MKRGPVPIEIYDTKVDTHLYCFIKDEIGEFVTSKDKPNMDYFSDYEVELMQRLIEIYATTWMTTNVMSDASHEDIKAWQRTWYSKPNTIIEYALEFDGDTYQKNEDELSFPEEVFLTHKALAS